MAKKKKTKVEYVEQSAVQVAVILNFPVTSGDEVNKIRKLVASEDVFELVSNYYFLVNKINQKLVQIKEPVLNEIDEDLKAIGIE